MADTTTVPDAAEPDLKEDEKKKRDRKTWIAIIIIGVIVVFASLLITVLIAPELHSLGDLFNFIARQ